MCDSSLYNIAYANGGNAYVLLYTAREDTPAGSAERGSSSEGGGETSHTVGGNRRHTGTLNVRLFALVRTDVDVGFTEKLDEKIQSHFDQLVQDGQDLVAKAKEKLK